MHTKGEAERIITTFCKLHYDGRYVLNEWSGNVEDVMTLAETLGLK